MHPDISFRPITDDDQELLYRIYASTREEELAIVDWTEKEKEDFLRMQFQAQHIHYQRHYGDSSFDIILLKGEPIGRLYLHRRPEEHRIVDIAILAEHRGQGLGGSIMQNLLDEAAAAGKLVRIHVEMNNPAMHLYERLGFRRIGEEGVYYLMEWSPPEEAGKESPAADR